MLGWVANWRPLEIFLYDWWPIARRRDLYRRFSAAVVEKKPYADQDSNKRKSRSNTAPPRNDSDWRWPKRREIAALSH